MGRFDPDLHSITTQLDSILTTERDSIKVLDPCLYFKSKAIIAEVYDYFGEIEKSQRVTGEGAEIFDTLPEAPNPSRMPPHLTSVERRERQVLREKIRFCLDYVQAHLYRRHRYSEAKLKIEYCLKLVRDQLCHEPEFPCYGTLGQIMYYLGRTLRQMGDYDEAERCFAQAIDYYHLRVRDRIRRGRGDQRIEREFANYRTAVCLGLGLAWVNYTRGYLTRALHHIYPARALLSEHAGINRAYVELIYGIIQNALAGNDQQRRREAITAMTEAYETFAGRGNPVYAHARYEARAAFGLAIAYFRLRDLSQARLWAERVHQIAVRYEDHRWMGHALIVKSRVLREQGALVDAEEVATQAYELAEAWRQLPCRIEALIARAEARLARNSCVSARTDLNTALELSLNERGRSRNPKLEAVCCLHLARTYTADRDYVRAKRYFGEWAKLRDRVEHRSVHDLAERVETEIHVAGRDFVIKAGDADSLNYKRTVVELRRFLLTQAQAQVDEKKGVARLLGITRQALHKWEKDLARHTAHATPPAVGPESSRSTTVRD